MKFLSIIVLLLFTVFCADAQQFRVVYVEEPNIEAQVKEISDPQEAVAARQQLAQMTRDTYLYYSNLQSIYSKSNLTIDIPKGTNDMVFIIDNNNKLFKDHKKREAISQETIMEKYFLIEEPLDESRWTLTNETAQIAGYDSKKAISKEGDIVWYTMDIPVQDGPLNYWGLPGMVLKVETPYVTYSVKEINSDYDTKGIIKEPTEGKKVTRKEFEALFMKKMNEMQSNFENGDY